MRTSPTAVRLAEDDGRGCPPWRGTGGNYSWGSGILRDASLPLPSCSILVNDEEAICDTVLDHAVLHNNHQTYALELLAN
jgi:hypothetical protein